MALTNEEILLKDRIRHLLRFKKKTITDFAPTDTLRARFGRQINGDASVPFTTLYKILYEFHDIDANWLILGDGQMIKSLDYPHIHNTTNEVKSSKAGGSIYVGTSTIPYPVQALLDEKDKRIAELESDKRQLQGLLSVFTAQAQSHATKQKK